jgi:hypothetical protein
MPAAIRHVAALPDVLYRIGRAPDPLAWPPPRKGAGTGRFDDPAGGFRVLYAAEQRIACFVETLAPFRVSLEWLGAVRRVRAGDRGSDEPEGGVIPADWLARRRIAAFALPPGRQWLDLRALETRVALRGRLASLLATQHQADFDLGDALSRNRPLTQAVARWAYDEGFDGVVYTSRFACAFDCWAIFDRVGTDRRSVTAIHRDDPDLEEVARLFDLRMG